MIRTSVFVAASLAGAALVAAPAALAQPAAVRVSNVTVTAGKPAEFHFIVVPGTVKSGVIVFKITNKGVLPHDFKLCSKRNQPLANSCTGRGTRQINPGQTTTLRVSVLLKGAYEYLCTVSGHAAGGMKGIIKVT
jgi:uncharacterized cupredoxin-like copper-binding protein